MVRKHISFCIWNIIDDNSLLTRLRDFHSMNRMNCKIPPTMNLHSFIHETIVKRRDRLNLSVSIFSPASSSFRSSREFEHNQLAMDSRALWIIVSHNFENDAWHAEASSLQNTKVHDDETSVQPAIQHTLNKSSKTVRFEMRVNRMAHYLLWAQLITTTFSKQKPKNDRELRGENYTH